MRDAAQVTAKAHRWAMAVTRPGVHEAELAALSDGEHNEEVVNVLSKAPNAPLVAPIPVAPTNEVTITTGDSDEDMLAELQAEFA